MQVEHIGKNMEVNDFIKAYAEHKLERLKHYLKGLDIAPDSVRVRIVYDFEKHGHRYRVDMDVYLNTPRGGVIHAWEESHDLFSAIDFVIDEVERQLVRLKQRRTEAAIREARLEKLEKIKELTAQADQESSTEKPLIIVEPLPSEKPMTVEDARLLLEETRAFFLPFINSETEEVNVIYRKKAGTYGLIVPRV